MSATNYESECLRSMVERFLDDGVIDSDEIIELVQFAMETVEKKTELSGAEKKKTAMVILKNFMESRVNNWLDLEKLISKAIDFGADVSKNGISKIVISSITITDTKSAFNLIYTSAMSKINEKYPLADDIINNIFDIAKYILELIEGQTQMKENEKKILLKKILNNIVQTTNVSFTDEQKEIIKSNIDSTVSLITIGWRTIESGKLNVSQEEVINIFTTCFQKILKCFKKNSTSSPDQVVSTVPESSTTTVDNKPPVAVQESVQESVQEEASKPVEQEVVALLISTTEPSEPIDIPSDTYVEIELEKELSNVPNALV